MSTLRAISFAALFCLVASPALADKPIDRGPTPGLGWGAVGSETVGSGGSKTLGAPGPVAGVGLPAILVVGGYLWFVRRKQRNNISVPKE